jgi:type I restriction-modification system DNA methylase subunit
MSEELLQTVPTWIGRYIYYRLGSTTLNQLKKAKIINKIKRSLAEKKPDGLIVLPGGIVKAVIEYKSSSELSSKNKIQSAIEQELEVARFLCKLLIVTDGTKTFWINSLNGKEIYKDGKKISTVFDASRILSKKLTMEEKIDLENLIDQAEYSLTEIKNNIEEPKVLDPTPLAKEVWQKIWINTGKEPEKCLYNVVEVFVFKFLSDISVLDSTNNFNSVFQIKLEKSNEAALRRYANQCRQDIKDMFPEGTDGTTIFNGTIFVNEKGNPNLSQANLFGQVLESFQRYDEKNGSFRYVTKEFKTRLYETFLRQSAGVKNLGQYFTPRNVIQAMVKMSNANMLNEGARFCDPFCGVGGFVLETIAMTPTIYKMFEPKNGKINPKVTILGFDKGTDEKDDERTIILAKANMLIYFSDLLARYHSKVHLKSFSDNAFNKVFHLLRTNLGTFGKIDEQPFDLILTNPPYVTSGSSSIKEALNTEDSLKKYAEDNDNKLYYSANGRGTQSLAIEWIINNLKQGGQALVIVPDNLFLQINMLEYIKRTCNITGIISLPTRTFYATAQKTYILILQKKNNNSLQDNDIFTYLVSEIGETRDSKRFVCTQNDLIEAATLFNLFKTGNSVPVSKRCKILKPDTFLKLDNWLVDRLWTEEEKNELGIEDEKETISDEDFWYLVSEIRNYLDNILGDNIK